MSTRPRRSRGPAPASGHLAHERDHARLKEKSLVIARVGVRHPVVSQASHDRVEESSWSVIGPPPPAGSHRDHEIASRIEVGVADMRFFGAAWRAPRPGAARSLIDTCLFGTWIV